jgi:hypothetical protein
LQWQGSCFAGLRSLASRRHGYLFPDSHVQPRAITAGPDGNLWFTADNGIGRITPSGDATVFSSPAQVSYAVTTGRDGNLWYTDYLNGAIGQVDFSDPTRPDPTQASVNCSPDPVAAGTAATCTATVTDTASSPATPTGTVSFSSTGSGSFSGSGSCALSGSGASGQGQPAESGQRPGRSRGREQGRRLNHPSGGRPISAVSIPVNIASHQLSRRSHDLRLDY